MFRTKEGFSLALYHAFLSIELFPPTILTKEIRSKTISYR